jgi:hypothetical protein
MSERLHQWTKARSLGFHLLFALVATGCAIAADWQIHRAMQGNVLSYFYSVEWPAIAIVAGIGWWQLVHDTPEDIARRSEYHRKMRAASVEVVARTLPRSARALTVGSTEVATKSLGGPAARAVTGGTGGTGSTGSTDGPTGAALVPTAGREADVRLVEREEPAESGADELDEYNRYLATLALKGRPKTWRNPRGL